MKQPAASICAHCLFSHPANRSYRLRLTSTIFGFCLVSACLFLIQQASAQAPSAGFEVASVKPAAATDPNTGSWSLPGIGRFSATHVSLALLCQLAYGVNTSQIANKPGWFEAELYDVNAKPEAGIKLSRDELKPRLQMLLRERFHLVVHTEMRSSRGYALVSGERGSHLIATKGDHFPDFRIDVSPGSMCGANWSMRQLAQHLTSAAGVLVVDRTGLAGSFDISFRYRPDADNDSSLPSLDAALKKATGLVLKPEKVSVETLVIDSVKRVPTAN